MIYYCPECECETGQNDDNCPSCGGTTVPYDDGRDNEPQETI